MVLEQYKLSRTDEIMEFLWLKPFRTGLNVDIFVDDGGSFIRNDHELLVFARNGYEKSISEFIPFSVSETPRILDTTIEYHVSYDDIFAIQDFIAVNKLPLIQLANSEISHKTFLQLIKVPSYNLDSLLLFARGDIDYVCDFLPNIVKG